jgi:hypothetical protein
MSHVSRTPRRPRSHVQPRALKLAARAAGAPQALRIPITNVYVGDYTAQILLGTEEAPANVILDTGSSTLAIKPHAYPPGKDTAKVTTSLAQVVLYGTGGWAGPVLETIIGLGNVSLPKASFALTESQEAGNFGNADGILGLAYNIMNNAFDLKAALAQKHAAATYPWPFKLPGTQDGLVAFEQELQGQPQIDVDPYFQALEEQNIVANKLAFYTLRSFPRVSSANASPATLAKDKLNNGFLILGDGEAQTDLYTGAFSEVSVVDDLYYNVNLKSVRVGTQPAVAAAPLQAQFAADAGSNAIVDSGTNSLVLAPDVYAAIVRSLEKINPQFAALLQAGQADDGVPTAELGLANWPTLAFTLQGPTGDVTLTLQPSTYWQVDFPAPGRAMVVLSGQPAGAQTPNQSILGLPLMNNYYTVFDRSAGSKGVIKFAAIRQ